MGTKEEELIRFGSVFEFIHNKEEEEADLRLVTGFGDEELFTAHRIVNNKQDREKIEPYGGTHHNDQYTGEIDKWTQGTVLKAYERGLREEGYEESDIEMYIKSAREGFESEMEKGRRLV